MKQFEIFEKTIPAVPLNPIVEDSVEDDFDAIDPYQEFYDFLVDEGATPGDAWDAVWENPSRSLQIGAQLAVQRQTGLALAS